MTKTRLSVTVSSCYNADTTKQMNTKQLFATFTNATNWNAFLYVTYKTLFTALSFLLYNTLTTKDFALWANLNSTIFLFLLWIDCGFRKSIPRYCPEYANNKESEKNFIIGVLTFQICLLFASVPVFIYLSNRLIIPINPTSLIPINTIGSMLFVAEGIIAIIRLFFHSYFWNKQFNVIASVVMTIEMIANIIVIYHTQTSQTLLSAVLINKITASMIIIIVSIFTLKKLYRRPRLFKTDQNKPRDKRALQNEFIKHTAMMWINNNAKSLSERNFLIPFLTHTLGPAAANVFKIANDGALLLYRIVLKIIGTTDTSLFAHIETGGADKKVMSMAYNKLTIQIARLCLPLLGVALTSFFLGRHYEVNLSMFVFHAFIIMAVGYLIETLFLPSERILEVKRQYKYLALAYIPYIIMLILLFTGSIISYIGLLGSLALIQGVRLVSVLIMFYITRIKFDIRFPLKRVGILIAIITLAYAFIAIAFWFFVPVVAFKHIHYGWSIITRQ